METTNVIDERVLYPIHEEDSVVQDDRHDRQARHLADVVEVQRPDLWVMHDVPLYWIPENKQRYRAPDLSVIGGRRPEGNIRVYLAWVDPPPLLVGEIASVETRELDLNDRFADYQAGLRVPEYLFADPPEAAPRFWRLVDGSYRAVEPDADGRVWSEAVGVGFGYGENDFLRVYDRATGRLLPSHAERKQREEQEVYLRGLAEEQARQERERAETEITRRVAAEQRAQREAQQRVEAERRLAEMAIELERLRRREGDRG